MSNPQGLDSQPGVLPVLSSKRQVQAFYNRIAKIYDLFSQQAERPLRRAGIGMLAPAGGERLLEIGFGTGHVLVELARAVGPTGKVLGLDISQNMCALAQARVERAKMAQRVALLCGDAAELPLERDSLDGIVTCFALELLDTPEIPLVLKECQRVLRRGGRMVVVAVSREGAPGRMVRLLEWTHRHFPNLMGCRPIYVRRALEAAGFLVEDHLRETMWVPVEIVRATKLGWEGQEPMESRGERGTLPTSFA